MAETQMNLVDYPATADRSEPGNQAGQWTGHSLKAQTIVAVEAAIEHKHRFEAFISEAAAHYFNAGLIRTQQVDLVDVTWCALMQLQEELCRQGTTAGGDQIRREMSVEQLPEDLQSVSSNAKAIGLPNKLNADEDYPRRFLESYPFGRLAIALNDQYAALSEVDEQKTAGALARLLGCTSLTGSLADRPKWSSRNELILKFRVDYSKHSAPEVRKLAECLANFEEVASGDLGLSQLFSELELIVGACKHAQMPSMTRLANAHVAMRMHPQYIGIELSPALSKTFCGFMKQHLGDQLVDF